MFNPDLKQLEKIAECQAGGMGLTFAAQYLGCSPEELRDWRIKCIDASRDYLYSDKLSSRFDEMCAKGK